MLLNGSCRPRSSQRSGDRCPVARGSFRCNAIGSVSQPYYRMAKGLLWLLSRAVPWQQRFIVVHATAAPVDDAAMYKVLADDLGGLDQAIDWGIAGDTFGRVAV